MATAHLNCEDLAGGPAVMPSGVGPLMPAPGLGLARCPAVPGLSLQRCGRPAIRLASLAEGIICLRPQTTTIWQGGRWWLPAWLSLLLF